MPYSLQTCPPAVRRQIDSIADTLEHLLGDNLIGIYLHGSLSTGCFNPARSDLDLLAVTEHPIDQETRPAVARALLDLSRTPIPIEISFLTRCHLHPWRYPTPFDLHFSEDWRDRFERGETDVRPTEQRHDADLAAHITHLHDRGMRLRGAPIADVFPAVPIADYRASIIGDYDDARDNMGGNPVYGILNLARVWRHLEEGALSSKEEGGAWALERVPADLRPVVANALAEYRGEPAQPPDSEQLARYAAFVDGRIAALQRERREE